MIEKVINILDKKLEKNTRSSMSSKAGFKKHFSKNNSHTGKSAKSFRPLKNKPESSNVNIIKT